MTRSSARLLDPDEVALAVRRAVLEAHEIDVHAVAFTKPLGLPRTTSGKLQRGKAREQFLSGTLPIAALWTAGRDTAMADPETSRASADRMITWLRDFADTTLDSRAMDEARAIPAAVTAALAEAGLFGLEIPSAFGGAGLSRRDLSRVLQQLAAINTTLSAHVWAVATLGTRPILRYGSRALKRRVLPDTATGKAALAFALTEPAAGSNPRAMRTTATPDGAGGWRINGEKWWIGNGSTARFITVFCRMLDGAGGPVGFAAFVVEGQAEGITHSADAHGMGLRAMVQSAIRFHDVAVTEADLLGLPGEGFQIATDALAHGRLTLAMGAVGGIYRALQLMHRYASGRIVGTGLLLDNPVTRERMATLLAKADGLAALVDHVAGALDEGREVPTEIYSIL
ncbi:MAG: acyl-CoA dehydrogenase family protein, partial [Pseudomonadota bacterium]